VVMVAVETPSKALARWGSMVMAGSGKRGDAGLCSGW
jgi:hypothetical protein